MNCAAQQAPNLEKLGSLLGKNCDGFECQRMFSVHFIVFHVCVRKLGPFADESVQSTYGVSDEPLPHESRLICIWGHASHSTL